MPPATSFRKRPGTSFSLQCAAASLCAVLLSGCVNPGYPSASVTAEKIATPSNSLPHHEYPFDDKGNYRKDWVVPPRGRSSTSSSSGSYASSSGGSTTRRSTSTSSSSSSSSSRTSSSTSSSSSSSAAKPKPAARYHKVQSGDTLYGISRKYGVSVSSLKSVNGLSSDLIRIGQTLRIP